jgi:zeta-carotene desaturase
MRNVTIVGAGIAGMTAALRLLERGFHVTLLEQDAFMGGMLRACTFDDEATGDRHEHSYHMLMNWYVNLWDLIDELGVRDKFAPSYAFNFLRRGQAHAPKMLNVGSPADLLRNITSGAAPLPDLFVFMYSMIDLLSTPMHRDDFLDNYSVNGFMRSRLYSTDRAAELQQKVWETVWAIPCYNASAKSYKNFLKYGNFAPVPQLWLFKENKYDALIGPLEQKLRSFKDQFQFVPLAYVNELVLDDTGRVVALNYAKAARSPSIDPRGWHKPKEPDKRNEPSVSIKGDLILALTPGALARLVKGPVYERDPKLGDVRKIHSEPMASVELHFKEGKWVRHVPKDVCVLMDAKYQMTFLDYSQHWPDQTSTFLYVTVSDCESLMSVPPEKRREVKGHSDAKKKSPGKLVLDLHHPTTAIEYLLAELHETLPFDPADIDLERTRIQTNTGEELFANEVGSEQWRPTTVTGIPNLFLAGTYCQNYADVATIEGAVTSGLLAAERVRARAGVMPPIRAKTAGYHHESLFAMLKVLWAPYAYGAKLWSMANDAIGSPGGDYLAPWLQALGTARNDGARNSQDR